MLTQFSRTELLFGKEAMEKLAHSRVAVFGIGGVGGYVCEALVRSGVGAFDLIDDDKVCLTNLNRQIIATRSTVGKYKTDVMMERMKDINPDVEVQVHKCFFLPIDRQNNRAALVTIRHAAELLGAGTVSIGVYPEGARSKTGELLPFRNGAFQIAKRGNAPIVIARTTGTENIAKNFARRTTCVTFEILDVLPAEAAAGMSTCEIGNHARQLILGGAE